MDLSYPIGKFDWSAPIVATPEWRSERIAEIAAAPALFREATARLNDAQLDTPYRPGGWTVRQVVHHVPDSHMNCFIRFRMALTEKEPVIKPYDQVKWAELPDSRTGPIQPSLQLLESLHRRWVFLMRAMSQSDFVRVYHHPELRDPVSLDAVLAAYAWHGQHHAAHIAGLRQRMNWK